MIKRDLYISLYWSGRQPDIAHQIDATYSIKEYTAALSDSYFIDFAKEYDTNFIAGIDGLLLGRLQLASDALSKITPEHSNYPRIQEQYLKLLKLTSPIIERLAQIHEDTMHHEGLTLVIKDE